MKFPFLVLFSLYWQTEEFSLLTSHVTEDVRQGELIKVVTKMYIKQQLSAVYTETSSEHNLHCNMMLFSCCLL